MFFLSSEIIFLNYFVFAESIYSDRETGNLRFDRFYPVYRISGGPQKYFSG
jgi:hypothetical protein